MKNVAYNFFRNCKLPSSSIILLVNKRLNNGNDFSSLCFFFVNFSHLKDNYYIQSVVDNLHTLLNLLCEVSFVSFMRGTQCRALVETKWGVQNL